MGFTSTLPLYSHTKIRPSKQSLRFEPLASDSGGRLVPYTTSFGTWRCYSRSKRLTVKAAYGAEGGARRRIYRQSQAEQPTSSAPVKQVASFVVPAGVFVAATFVLWKVVEKLLMPKPSRSSSVENKSPSQGLKWSFAPGTNLLSGFAAKIDRQSKQTLNEFAKELRAFSSVDMSGRNFGDEGLFFLAESLGYNKIVEEVSFAGAKAIAELLKKNSTLRVLELNNNMIDYSGFTSLAGAFLENNTVRNLHLNGNYGGALGANALAKGLEGNKSLRELHLHGNSIGDEGVRSLLLGLSSHKGKITLLDLGNNSITAKGAFHVAEYIKKSKSLLWVNLYMNDIGDEGADKIADALKQNRAITTIDLGGNNIHAKGVSVIAEALKDNTIITNLELGYNPIGPDGAKALSEVLKFHGNVKTLKLGWCQ
ncbi:Leucine-rich repeats-ribonuclease inhibitor domain-containing protein isoform 3, partial [Theobroma cacao]